MNRSTHIITTFATVAGVFLTSCSSSKKATRASVPVPRSVPISRGLEDTSPSNYYALNENIPLARLVGEDEPIQPYTPPTPSSRTASYNNSASSTSGDEWTTEDTIVAGAAIIGGVMLLGALFGDDDEPVQEERGWLDWGNDNGAAEAEEQRRRQQEADAAAAWQYLLENS